MHSCGLVQVWRQADDEVRWGAQLANFLRRSRKPIRQHWADATRGLERIGALPSSARFDHLPSLLDHIAAVAEELEAPEPLRRPTTAAARHAADRLDQGFELGLVVQELGLLRESVIALWDRVHEDGGGALRVLNRVIDDAIAASVDAFMHARDQTLRSIDRVDAAAPDARSLAELLARLLDAFVSAAPEADAAAIVLVQGGGGLHVRAAIGLEPEVAEHFSVRGPAGPEGLVSMIVRTREPVYIADVAAHAVRAATPGGQDVKALFGVPLVDQGQVIGVAHVGSRTARELSQMFRRLFASMAARAASGIVQHLARELSNQRAAQLAASEQQLRTTFKHAPVGIAHVALDGSWLRMNPRYCQILGYSESELRGLRYQDLARVHDLVTVNRAVEALLTGKLDTYVAEQEYQRPTGEQVWIRLTASLVRGDSDGARYFIAILEDVTERRRIEDALRAGEDRALKALAALDSLLAACPTGVLFIDTDLRYVRVNETLARMNGLAVEAHLGRTVRETIGSRADEVEPLLHRVLERGEVIVSEVEMPNATLGQPRVALATLFPVRAPAGDVLGVGGIVMDITERQRMEDALRQTEQRAQYSVKLRDQVLAIVSHDLKSPLGAIRMAVSLVLQASRLDAEVRKYAEVIERASSRMHRLITDLLDFANIESGRLSLDLRLHEVRGIIAEAHQVHQELARSKNIELGATSPADCRIRCDRERILQVLGNLIGNALKFTGPDGRVDVEAHRVGGEVVFTVTDTGPGIAPGELAHLFEAYWTTALTASQGTGLGLYICKRIVEAHGGRIGARNREPHGAVLWFAVAAEPGG